MHRRIAGILLALCILAGSFAALAAAGSSGDPFISVSWLYDVFQPKLEEQFRSETETALDGLKEELTERLDALSFPEKTEEQELTSPDRTEIIHTTGGTVTLGEFSGFVPTAGDYVLRTFEGEVLDLSTGNVCAAGEALQRNHRYFAAEESSAVIQCRSAAGSGYADGCYTWEKEGTLPAEDRFNDLNGHWAKECILALAEKGIVNGTDTHTFSPDTSVTRAMFVTVLGRYVGVADVPSETPFADVPRDSWYAAFVAWAYRSQIVNGYDEKTFAPDDQITREQMAVILIRFCDAFGVDLTDKNPETGFADEDAISSWAVDAVHRARRAGLVNGVGENRFNPAGTATRAEMCAVISRLN